MKKDHPGRRGLPAKAAPTYGKRPFIFLWGVLAILLALPLQGLARDSIAFYYGSEVPVHLLAHFHQVVLEPDHLPKSVPRELVRNGSLPLAYVSVGEVGSERNWAGELDPAWQLGRNPEWNSRIMDLSSQGWQDYLFQHRFRPLWKLGYRGFFLDTLDSHLQVAMDPAARQSQLAGLATIIERLRREFPESVILLNRGFEVIDRVGEFVNGMAAESLYQGWDPATNRYREVNREDREWLLNRLKGVQQQFPKLSLVVIDYLPPNRRDQAREVARKIRQAGFIPWVTNASLDQLGVGEVEVLPREILMLYDSSQGPRGELVYTDIHRLAALPVEYLGYVPVYHDLRQGLPKGTLRGRYAGVISWFGGPTAIPGHAEWIAARIAEGTPILMLGSLGFEPDDGLLTRMGLTRAEPPAYGPWKVAASDSLIGFEAQPPRMTDGETEGFLPLPRGKASKATQIHLSVVDESGKTHGVVITATWGGLALSPWLLDEEPEDRTRWIVDPFALIRKALNLEDLPLPNVTTLNGRRLWMNHIDGDGFVSRAEFPDQPLAAEVIRDRILKRYDFPHTVSVIEGEIGPEGLYPRHSKEYEAVARSIFRLPNVEPASHSYSHPFAWSTAAARPEHAEGYHLPIPGYRYDARREILGSMRYVEQLLPPGEKCRIFLWTGDALPGKKELALVEEHGFLDMNGGDTTITRKMPFLVHVSPMARPVESYLQAYAPVMNENVYTGNWTGPFWGFRKVIETFELTDRPRRLKPIDIYYHFYSGTKPASLKALEQVYDWAQRQETTPVFASEYIPLVTEFRRISLARRSDGRLQYRGIQRLRELRLFRGSVKLDQSRQLAGQRRLQDGLYLHLSGDRPVIRLASGDSPPTRPFLHQANGHLERWRTSGKGTFDILLRAHVPALLEMAGVRKECSLRLKNGKVLKATADARHRVRFQFHDKRVVDGTLNCR